MASAGDPNNNRNHLNPHRDEFDRYFRPNRDIEFTKRNSTHFRDEAKCQLPHPDPAKKRCNISSKRIRQSQSRRIQARQAKLYKRSKRKMLWKEKVLIIPGWDNYKLNIN